MKAFDHLSNIRRTSSGTLSRTLAQHVLNGRISLLMDCIDLISYEINAPSQQHFLSDAAKVIEIVALNRPDLVSPYLHELIPALSVKVSQTRCAIIRTMGFCAHLNKVEAQNALPYAEKYIDHKEGFSLAKATDMFLGDFGAISPEDAQRVFPLLERSMQNLIVNEQDWLLEALFRIFEHLGDLEQKRCIEFAEGWQQTARKMTQQRVKKIMRMSKST